MKRPFETSFHVKTDHRTKKLVEQLLFKLMTEQGHLSTKAEAFAAIVAKCAKAEGIGK